MSQSNIRIKEIIRSIKMLRGNITVPSQFKDQVIKIDQLMRNDKTGIVSSVVDYMVNNANVPLNIESDNETLNKQLKIWQETLINRDVNVDIPIGLKSLSEQYYRERWRSSFIGLQVIFEEVDFGGNIGKFELPTKMWLVDGASLESESTGDLTTRKYFVRTGKALTDKSRFKNTKKKSVYVRKPYNLWHEEIPTPYLVKNGALFNALLKIAIIQKQADVIEVIIPYLLNIQAGNDKLAETNLLPTGDELSSLKEKFIKATEALKQGNANSVDSIRQIVSALSYDVNVEHLIPDLKKIFDPEILKSVDRNLLSALGLIEMEAFSKNRQEAVLNPKILVEEVQDAVNDWSALMEQVLTDTMLRNLGKHRKLANSSIDITPGVIQGFLTDGMKQLVRSLYDRGLVSKESMINDVTKLKFKVETKKRKVEFDSGLNDLMFAPIIQNLERDVEPSKNVDQEKQDNTLPDRQPGTPEADNFNQAILNHYSNKHKKKKTVKKSLFNDVSELPDNVKNVLPTKAQIIWLRVFNDTLESTNDEQRSISTAWSVVKETYKKIPGQKKWVKK